MGKFYLKAGNVFFSLLVAGGVLFSISSLAAVLQPFNFTAPLGVSSQGVLKPIIFNAPVTAQPGDIVGFQGENFGTAPAVILEGIHAGVPVVLPLVNTHGTGWLSFKVPQNVTGSLVVHVSNGQTISASIKLNAARAYHLDAMQLVPGGAFRIFGRNLYLPGSTPIVMVNGLPAVVNFKASDENMLVATAPQGLHTTSKTVITVDNGNGTGPSVLDRKITVIAGSKGDPYALGVGWAAGFSDYALNVINAKTDYRLKKKVVCNGSADDTSAIQSAIQLASASGGGVVRLPAGKCLIASNVVQLQSRVVLQGAGKDSTIISVNGRAFYGVGIDLAGVKDLTVTNTVAGTSNPKLINSTRIFLKNVKFNLGGATQVTLEGNTNILVMGCDFNATSNGFSNYGPYSIGASGGVVFTGNKTTLAAGASDFGKVHDAYIANNTFTNDAINKPKGSILHSFAMNFAYRITVVENVFDVIGNTVPYTSNDGEAMLSEGGGGKRTENLGMVVSATATTLKLDKAINVFPFGGNIIPENYGVAIVGGKGAGQSREVVAYSSGTLTVDQPWGVVPDASSRYATFVWGLEKSLIKGNTFSNNPWAISLYTSATREVDIIGNKINEGGGIYLFADQRLSANRFDPIYNVRIVNNSITHTTTNFASCIDVAFARLDADAFGIGVIGVQVMRNTISTKFKTLSPAPGLCASAGYQNLVYVSAPKPISRAQANETTVLGSIFQDNKCTNCGVGYNLGGGKPGIWGQTSGTVQTIP